MSNKMHVKTGDTVIVISGRDKGKKGKVLQVSPSEGKIIVEGVKMVSKHVKPRQPGDPSGIVKAESAFYACKAMPYCGKCGKGSRLGHNVLANGKKERVCKRCGKRFE